MDGIVLLTDNITETTKDTKRNMSLSTSYAVLEIDTSQLTDQMRRELPAILFEFYVNNGSNKYMYLQNKNVLYESNQIYPMLLALIPTDAEIRIVPQFDEEYISRIANPTNVFPIKIYLNRNIIVSKSKDEPIIKDDGYLILEDTTDGYLILDGALDKTYFEFDREEGYIILEHIANGYLIAEDSAIGKNKYIILDQGNTL